MHVPGLLERVRVFGFDEVYLVTRIDYEAQAADLLPLIYGRLPVQSVPFLAMESIPGCGSPDLEYQSDLKSEAASGLGPH